MQEEEVDSSITSSEGKWVVSHSVWPDLSQKGWANLAVDMADPAAESGPLGSGGKADLGTNSKVTVDTTRRGVAEEDVVGTSPAERSRSTTLSRRSTKYRRALTRRGPPNEEQASVSVSVFGTAGSC